MDPVPSAAVPMTFPLIVLRPLATTPSCVFPELRLASATAVLPTWLRLPDRRIPIPIPSARPLGATPIQLPSALLPSDSFSPKAEKRVMENPLTTSLLHDN